MDDKNLCKSRYCAAYGCKNAKYKADCREKSFFRFPLKNQKLLKEWLIKLRREEFSPSPWSVLCSDHFEETDFKYENFTNRRLLKQDAVPSKFVFSKPKNERRVIRRQLPEQGNDENEDACTTETSLGNKTQTSSFSDIIDELSLAQKEACELKNILSSKEFKPENINSDEQMVAVTGFTKQMFFALFKFLNIEGDLIKGKTLRAIDQFFLFLIKLRTGISNEFLSLLFHISDSTVSRYFVHTVGILNKKFRILNIWPSKDQVAEAMPSHVSRENKNCRVIIDCTEFNIQKPSNPREQQMTFSSYKNNNTLKGMIGIMPSGAITFISDLYCGSISDKELFLQSGIMNKLEAGDMVMADKGWKITC